MQARQDRGARGGHGGAEGVPGGVQRAREADEEEQADEAWILYGITSWGAGCARERSPGVYVKVTKMLEWINEVTRVKHNGMAHMVPNTWGELVGDDQEFSFKN